MLKLSVPNRLPGCKALISCDAAHTMLDCHSETSQTLGSRLQGSLSNCRAAGDAQELSPHLWGLSLSSLNFQAQPPQAMLSALALAAVRWIYADWCCPPAQAVPQVGH